MNIAACENLATKAELQELKNQINALLGQTEDGGIQNVLQLGTLGATTVLGGTVLLAKEGIQGIELAGSVGGDIGRELANGTAQWVKVKGNGGRVPLPDLTRVAKKTAGTAVVTQAVVAKTAGVAAAATSAVALIASTAVSVGLNIASTKILGNRIDKTENGLLRSQQDFANGVYSSLSKHRDDFDAARLDLEQAQIDIENQQSTIDEINSDILDNNNDIQDLFDKNHQLETNLRRANSEIRRLDTELGETSAIYGENIDEAQQSINSLQDTVREAFNNIEILEKTIEAQKEDIVELRSRIEFQEVAIENLSINISLNRLEIINLKADIEANKTLAESSVNDISSKVKILENQQNRGGGIPASVQNSIVEQQTTTVEILDRLTGNETNFSTDYSEIVSGDNGYTSIVENLLNNVPNVNDLSVEGQVTPEQLTEANAELEQNLSTQFEQILGTVIATTVLPQLTTIQSQTTSSAITSAAETATCNTTAPGGCMRTNILDPIQSNLGRIGQGLGFGSDLLNVGLNTNILGKINTMQTFLNTAWNSTTTQKLLTTTNTILAFHNAAMLSRNLGQSIGDTLSLFINAIDVPGFDGEDINVNDWVEDKFETLVQGVIGEEAYTTIGEGFVSANRILVAGQGMLSAVHGVKNAIQEGQEVIANRVGVLGNTFLEQGIFDDNSFDFMSTDTDFRSPFNGFTQRIQGINEFIEEVNQLVQSGIEVQESFNEVANSTQEFTSASQELRDSFTAFHEAKQEDEAEKETESASPNIDIVDTLQVEADEVVEENV